MSTFMGKDPQTSPKTALNESICSPEHATEGGRGNILRCEEVVEEVERKSERADVASNVAQSTDSRALEAMSRNGIPDLLNGEVRHLKFVAVCIEHLSLAFVEYRLRVEGGKRCAGW